MMGLGLRQSDVSKLLRMDEKTLRKHYRHELDTGALAANAAVADSLFHMATRDKVPSAAIFWLKARAGWRERDVHDVNIGGQPNTPLLLHLAASQEFSQLLSAERQTNGASPPTIDAEPEPSSAPDLYAPATE